MTNQICIAKGKRPKEGREKTGKTEERQGGKDSRKRWRIYN